MADLSVLIPARNERWLARTVADVCEKMRGDTDVWVVLDGAWPEAGYELPQHPKVHVIYLPQPIGQRAATNLAARQCSSRYVMKLDAHCAVAEGFDVELMATGRELGEDVTQIPLQKNLHVWAWVCDPCNRREYQSPTDTCVACGAKMRMDVVWKPRGGTSTTSWYFDTQPKFGYWGEGAKRQQGDICDVMTSLGACFFMSRDRFWQLGGLDTGHGSWGSMGIEVACKSWLSGGRHVVNKRAWFAHFFRTGGLGFPYPMRGSDQDRAREYAKDLWFNNKWPGQVRPLSWLIEKFAPVPGWHDAAGSERLAAVMDAGAAFTLRKQSGLSLGTESRQVMSVNADGAATTTTTTTGVEMHLSERMPLSAVGLQGLVGNGTNAAQDVYSRRDEPEMGRVAAAAVIAEVIDHDAIRAEFAGERPIEPCGENAVNVGLGTIGPASRESDARVTTAGGDVASPQPASAIVSDDLGKDSSELLSIEMWNREILGDSHASALSADVRSGADVALPRNAAPSILAKTPTKSVVYYSDCRIDPAIDAACRRSIEQSGLPIVAVTLKPIDWPAARNVVLPLERGYLTLFKQMLVGLLVADTDVAFLAEHDVIYDASHWDFTPPSADCYYYNLQWVKVDADTGKAVTYTAKQTSQLCADRALLVGHYLARVARVEREGFSRAMGFEPGSHGRKERIDDVPSDVWRSARPNYDIRHTQNLTPTRWKPEQFRNQKHCEGWQELTVNLPEVAYAAQ